MLSSGMALAVATWNSARIKRTNAWRTEERNFILSKVIKGLEGVNLTACLVHSYTVYSMVLGFPASSHAVQVKYTLSCPPTVRSTLSE